MRIVEIILSAVLNILSIYINFRLIDFFLEKKALNRAFTLSVYILTWSINFVIYNMYENVYFTSVSLILLLLISTVIIYKGTIIRKLVAVFSSVALGIVVEDIVWRFCTHFDLSEKIGLFAALIPSIILILLILLIEYFFAVEKNQYITKESYINILLVLLCNVILIYILTSSEEVEHLKAMWALIMICLIDISTFWLHNKVNEVYREKLEHQIMEEQISMYQKQFRIIKQSQNKIDSIQHDMKNHMLLINSYLENKNYAAAESYIKDIQNYISVPERYVDTGNQELDAILNYFLDKADKIHCKIETKIIVPDCTLVSEFDLNMLLGNLLDNALEALEKTEEKYLYIGISYHKGMMLINIKNSFDGILDKNGDAYYSRKKDMGKHGIGLRNIKEIVQKYNGEINIGAVEKMFNINIILYI